MEVDGMKTRSFRDEDYNNRRVFLRSYPLQWEEEEEGDGEEEAGEGFSKVSLKNRFIAVFQWSEGKVLLLRKLKNKIAVYLVSCQPFGFKSPNKLLTL